MSAKDVIAAVMESRFVKEVVAEGKHQVEAGAHELASAIFRGDGFVMYPHAGKENEAQIEAPQHGLPPEASKQIEPPQMEMER